MFKIINTKKNGWQKISYKECIALIDFLSPIERECIAFTSNISEKGIIKKRLFKKNLIFVEKRDNKIVSAIIITWDMTICPAFTEKTNIVGLDIIKYIPKDKWKFICIMGKKEYVKEIEKIFNFCTHSSIDYHLLSVKSNLAISNTNELIQSRKAETMNKLKIFSASLKDITLLAPLRYAYELEEVISENDNYSFESCKQNFMNILKTKVVLYAEMENEAIATCCINSEGLNWCYLGGVFTKPEKRSRGISTALIKSIAEYTFSKKKDLCLFVKKHNIAAINLYKKCGFSHCGEFRITYLESK